MTERTENSANEMQEILADTEGFLTDFKTLDTEERVLLISRLEEAVRSTRLINKDLIRQKFSGDPMLINRPGPEGKLAQLRENGCFTLDPRSSEIRSLSGAAQRLYGEHYYPNIQKHGERALANLALNRFSFYRLSCGVWVPVGDYFKEVKVETIDDLRSILDKNVGGKIYRDNPRSSRYHGWFQADILARFVAEWDVLRSQAS